MGSAPVHSSVKVGDEKKKPYQYGFLFSPAEEKKSRLDFFFAWGEKNPGRGAIESGRERNPTGIALIACDCDECRTSAREHGLNAVKLHAIPYSFFF